MYFHLPDFRLYPTKDGPTGVVGEDGISMTKVIKSRTLDWNRIEWLSSWCLLSQLGIRGSPIHNERSFGFLIPLCQVIYSPPRSLFSSDPDSVIMLEADGFGQAFSLGDQAMEDSLAMFLSSQGSIAHTSALLTRCPHLTRVLLSKKPVSWTRPRPCFTTLQWCFRKVALYTLSL